MQKGRSAPFVICGQRLSLSKGMVHNNHALGRYRGWWPVARSERRSPTSPALFLVMVFASFFCQHASADESGISFWQPGTFANLAAVPGSHGWSFTATYFHASLAGGSNVATADTLPLFPQAKLTAQLDADIKTNVDIAILTPGYTFATPVWGGRLAFNLFVPVGGATTKIDALVTGALGPIGFAAQNVISDNSRRSVIQPPSFH